MAQRPLNVLFVCEKNSIRSIMAEALLHRFSNGRFRAYSADLNPASELHPLTAEMLQASGLPTANLKPRNLSEFREPSAPKMDLVISIGSGVNSLPDLPGNPMVARWGISEPMTGNDDLLGEKVSFRRAFRELENRIRLFVLVRHDRGGVPTVGAAPMAQNA